MQAQFLMFRSFKELLMNNKALGTKWEKDFCKWLASKGWWVHFITPAPDGGQPFDVIAVKNGKALAIDCKTSAKATFSLNRLELNQKTSFNKWMRCGNLMPLVAVNYQGKLYYIKYDELKAGYVDLRKRRGIDL